MIMKELLPIFIMEVVLVVKGEALACRFGAGPACQYSCNCAGTCHPQTGCVGNCTRGWDGPTCQRRNVALDQRTSQRSLFYSFYPNFAVDGKVGHDLEATPCTHTQPDYESWWMVTLNGTYSIYRFQIYNRAKQCQEVGNIYKPCGSRLNGFTLSVGTNNQSYSTCYTDTTTSDYGPGDIINGTCNGTNPRTGDTVRISLPGSKPLTLCEVRLFVCSDGWYGEMCDKECMTTINCSQCDDGRLSCQTCVIGRWGKDCDQDCGHCWNNTACDKNTADCLGSSPRCEAGYKGSNCTRLCTAGRYGSDCGDSCGFCPKVKASCDPTSGHCPTESDQSVSGYTGQDCKSPCNSYRWGPDCEKTCGQCHGGAVCDRFSGECHPGKPRCDTGYTGPRCAPCDSGRWGVNCVNNCSEKCDNPACNVSTGVCEGGCHPGYTGEHCDTECPNGTYGVQCQSRCGQCKDGNHTCDHVNGTCTSCADGWQGDRCEEGVTPLPSLGNDASVAGISGGVAGALVLVLVVVVVVLVIRRRRRKLSQDAGLQPRQRAVVPNHGHPVLPDNIGCDEEHDDVDEDVDVTSAGCVNTGADAENTCIPVEKFRQHVLSKKASKGFKAEFETFPVGLHAKHDAADKPENKIKSRYRNLVAYDHSRVHLKQLGGKDTDYINACYINGYNEPKKYIASQGPTDVIIKEFMRMIWEQNTGKVVMVTNLVEKTKTKCFQYWPDEGSAGFGDIGVSLLGEKHFSNYVIRTLELTHVKMQNKTQIVKQFHFTAWPDHGAPSNASGILDFREKVLGYKSPLNGPIVVHCSAGIGRTGTFIALDYLINQAKEEGVVDVPACVRLLREQRVNMVQSVEQYQFLHEALAEALELQEGTIPGVDFSSVFADLCTVKPETGQTKIAEQFQRLNEKTCPLDKSILVTALHPDNLHKNRSPEIVAGDNCRPYLSTPAAGRNNYINAVFLPAYNRKRGFIITQTPLRETVVDFWRLVYDHDITTIVMLDDVENEPEDVGVYWPEKRKTFGPFDVRFKQKEEGKGFSALTYNVSYKEMTAPFPIKQFRCGFWSSAPTLASIPSLLSVIDIATAWQKETGNQPVLVHCRDGLTNSGLFCAASFVIERLKLDGDVNIPQAVKQMRVARPQIITDLDQFIFLHQVALGYLENLHTYANFK